MVTKFNDNCTFNTVSIVDGLSVNDAMFNTVSIVDGYLGVGTINLSSAIPYAITSFTSAARTIQADEGTTGDVAATLATLISDLARKGIIAASGGE